MMFIGLLLQVMLVLQVGDRVGVFGQGIVVLIQKAIVVLVEVV